jgi:ABC-type transport system involved in cytochrome c biogenesis permease component
VFPKLAAIGLGSSVALAALITLISGVAGTSRLRGVLVPLLTLPLLFPLFFAGVELTTECLLYSSVQEGSLWPGIILISATAFFLVGINSYEAVVRD